MVLKRPQALHFHHNRTYSKKVLRENLNFAFPLTAWITKLQSPKLFKSLAAA
jgi:hypothetical protein